MDSFENIKELVKEYEVILPAINEQLQFYQDEHASLKKEIITLSKENQSLTMKLENCLTTHTNFEPEKYKENDLIENLKRQLNLSLKEKDSVVELWRTSMTRIDFLERELKVFSANNENSSRNLIKKLKNTYENELKSANDQLRIANDKVQVTLKASRTSLASKKDELEVANEKISKLHEELDEIRGQMVAVSQERKNLQLDLEAKAKNIGTLKIEAHQAKLKVAEACHVIEAAFIEKDAALLREKEALEEISKLRSALSEIVIETENKVKMEVQEFKNNYEQKIGKYKLDVKRKSDVLENKELEINKLEEKCSFLEQELEEMKKSKEKLIQIANLDKEKYAEKYKETIEKLANIESKNKQYKKQSQETMLKMQKTKSNYKTLLCNKEILSKKLQTKVHNLQNDLQLSKLKFKQVRSQLEDLTNKMKFIDEKFKEELAIKESRSDQLLSQKVNEMESENGKLIKNLKAQLEAQINLNKKWKMELREVTEKLEQSINVLKSEITHLKLENNKLVLELQTSVRKCQEYKENLKSICVDVNSLTKNTL